MTAITQDQEDMMRAYMFGAVDAANWGINRNPYKAPSLSASYELGFIFGISGIQPQEQSNDI